MCRFLLAHAASTSNCSRRGERFILEHFGVFAQPVFQTLVSSLSMVMRFQDIVYIGIKLTQWNFLMKCFDEPKEKAYINTNTPKVLPSALLDFISARKTLDSLCVLHAYFQLPGWLDLVHVCTEGILEAVERGGTRRFSTKSY